MKLIQIAFSIYMGILFSFIFAILFSEAGLNHYNELVSYKTLLMNNIDELRNINENLKVERNSLLNDQETIRIYSRELGLYDEKEKIIRIEGYTAKKSFYTIGKLIKKMIIGVDYNQFLRILGLILPILIYIISYFILKIVKREHKPNRFRI